MARRLFVPLLATFAVLAAMAAFTAWSFTRTVGDPATSAEIIAAALEGPGMSSTLRSAANPALVQLEALGVPAEQAALIVDDVASDPMVVAALAASTAAAHSELLAGSPQITLTVPGSVLTAATRTAAAERGVDPALVPELADTSTAIPSAPHVARVANVAHTWPLALLVAVAALGAAVLMAPDRRALIGRVAMRLGTCSSLLVVACLGVSWLASRSVSPTFTLLHVFIDAWWSRVAVVLLSVTAVSLVVFAAARVPARPRSSGDGSPPRHRERPPEFTEMR